MSTKKKHSLFNIVIFLIVLSCVLYVVNNYNKKVITVTAKSGTIEDTIKSYGIVFIDETVYNSKTDGKVKFYYDEGDKIKSGILVMELYTDVNSHDINKEIAQIEKAIQKLENPSNNENQNINLEEFKKAEINIQNAVLNNDIDSLYDIVHQIENDDEVFLDINEYENYELEKLYTLRENMSESIEDNKIPYYANKAGVISYKFDGLEEIYSIKKIDQFSENEMNILDLEYLDNSKITDVSDNQDLFKIVNNFEYFILVKLNNKLVNIEENTYIKTRISNDDYSNVVYAYVEQINPGVEESVVVLKYSEYFYRYYYSRYIDVEIISSNMYEGIIIDSTAVTQKDNLIGVYVKDVSGVVKFFPIKIIVQNKDIIIASEGEKVSKGSRGSIIIDGKSYYTIKNYDEVILQPDKVYEGQILN